MSDVNSTFRRNMRVHRTNQGVTADALAQAIGMTRQMVSMIETGRSNLTLATAVAISQSLGVSISEMTFADEQCRHAEIRRTEVGWVCQACGIELSVAEPEVG